ncbi:3-hydroxyisobutyrate dehydrogenase [Zostera marina]|uniref:3-hydroxyisobutyrate dehydrogenase n=1 Tax=Zostera marina TaxID=29655 RepID=A0A0K9NN97_ZOSMR|nr:3-hydroxyisobutyrate dehydrogenase [Zostera marina]
MGRQPSDQRRAVHRERRRCRKRVMWRKKAFTIHSSFSIRWFSTKAMKKQPAMESIGFVGVGNMGFHMARSLIKSGFQISVHDKNQESMNRFMDSGIPTRCTPLQLAEECDVVITMLPSPSDVLEAFMGPNGFLQVEKTRPWLFIDSSTIDPQTSRKISANLSTHVLKSPHRMSHPTMLDAPVSGGVPGAEAATLTFMVGGLEEVFLEAKSLFLSMGKHAVYCGGIGNGAAAKLCNNLALAINMLGVSEAFILGQRLGITSGTLTDIFNSSSARCWSSDTYNPVPGVMNGVPSSRNYEGGFLSKLMLKDLDLALRSIKDMNLNCPLSAQALEIYQETCNSGHEMKDFSCVYRHYYSGKDDN